MNKSGIHQTSKKNIATALLGLTVLVSPLSTSHAILDKTRFALHLGAAYFAFHHWVLQPYKQHRFDAGTPGRTGSLVKGGAALLFAAHEVKVDERIVQNSHDPLLMKLGSSLGNLEGKFTSVGSSLKRGQLNPDNIAQLDGATNDMSSQAAAAGQPVRDVPVAIPGL